MTRRFAGLGALSGVLIVVIPMLLAPQKEGVVGFIPTWLIVVLVLGLGSLAGLISGLIVAAFQPVVRRADERGRASLVFAIAAVAFLLTSWLLTGLQLSPVYLLILMFCAALFGVAMALVETFLRPRTEKSA